uniref:Uncharacterized protein n=1 Tax=Trypanosoma congolense (strain IL3000) TaxID=1068625 RepID=G0UZL7_TRYCI|nr:hypothetical protein, unlikely [Trypanosoma congolense IL3000]
MMHALCVFLSFFPSFPPSLYLSVNKYIYIYMFIPVPTFAFLCFHSRGWGMCFLSFFFLFLFSSLLFLLRLYVCSCPNPQHDCLLSVSPLCFGAYIRCLVVCALLAPQAEPNGKLATHPLVC